MDFVTKEVVFRTAQTTVKSTGSSETTIIDKSIDKADEILLQVKAVFEKVLNIEQYSLTDSFLELRFPDGSLQRFHVKLDLREVLLDSSVPVLLIMYAAH